MREKFKSLFSVLFVVLFLFMYVMMSFESFHFRTTILEFFVVPTSIAFAFKSAMTSRDSSVSDKIVNLTKSIAFIGIGGFSIYHVYGWKFSEFLTILIIPVLLGSIIDTVADYLDKHNRKKSL